MGKDPAVCEITGIHPEALNRVRGLIESDERLAEAADLFKLMGDASRMRILRALGIEELCVCDLAELTGLSQSAVSHQLRLLRAASLVRYRRQGKMAFYTLASARVAALLELSLIPSRT